MQSNITREIETVRLVSQQVTSTNIYGLLVADKRRITGAGQE